MNATRVKKNAGQKTKSQIKEIAKLALLHALDSAPYAIGDSSEYTDAEKEVIWAEMRRQARRMRNIVGYE